MGTELVLPWGRRQWRRKWRRQRVCFVCVFTRRCSGVVRSSLIISRMDYVSVSPFSLLYSRTSVAVWGASASACPVFEDLSYLSTLVQLGCQLLVIAAAIEAQRWLKDNLFSMNGLNRRSMSAVIVSSNGS